MAVHIDKGEKEMLAERKPYVGVAAMRYQADIPIIAGYHELLDRRQILVLSFQTSSKTLRGEINNHPGVFPPFDKLRELLEHYSSHKEVELHIHFYSDNPREGLESELQQLADAVGDLIHGIQLNMAWPDPVIVEKWHTRFPNHRIILSLNNKAISQTFEGERPDDRLDPSEIVDIFDAHYNNIISTILWDLSGGLGKTIDVNYAAQYLNALRRRFPQVELAVAGGLGPRKMQPVAQLLPHFWPLSWDAQSKLYRNDQEVLDIRKARMYIHESGFLPYEVGV